MQIIKLNQFKRVVSTQTQRVTKVRSTNPDEQTFYLSSESRPGEEYVIQTRAKRSDPQVPYYLRSTQKEIEYLCSCPDYIIRRWAKHEDCKHIEVVKAFVTHAGSVSVLADLVRQEQ